MYTWRAFRSNNDGSKRPQWTQFVAAQKCNFRGPTLNKKASKNDQFWVTISETLIVTFHDKLQQKKFDCTNVLLSEVNIFHTSTFLSVIFTKSYVRFSDYVFLSGNAFLSFCEMGSSCSFGTSVGTLESPSCAQQWHGWISDDSSINGIIQSQNGYFNDFWV